MGEARVRAAHNAKRVVVPKPLYQTLVLDMAEPRRLLAEDLPARVNALPHPIPHDVIDTGPVRMYGAYLAHCSNEQLVPVGFVTLCEIAVYNIANPSQGDPVPSQFTRLTRMPEGVYQFLLSLTPLLAQAVTPPEFTEQVRVWLHHVRVGWAGR